jgi:hypothetical protein
MTEAMSPEAILERAERLAGMSANEAVHTLDGPLAEVKPDVRDFTFPGPIAEAYYWDDADVVAIQGPVGSGKTTTKMKRKLRRAMCMPMSVIDGVRYYKVLFVRETYRQLWATVIPSYLETFPRSMGSWSGGRGDPVRHHILFEDEHGLIDFVAEFMAFGDNIAASLRGLQVTDLDISEADTNPLETLTFGVGRINRYPAREHFAGLPDELRSYGQIDCDFNAPDEDNWTFKVFHDDKGRADIAEQLNATLPHGAKAIEFSFHRQPGYGEPGTENLQNLAPGYYELQIGLNKLAGKSDVTNRMVFNKTTYLRAGEPVFVREFNRCIHVGDDTMQPVPGLELLFGFDQGFKAAGLIAQFEAPFHWMIFDELHFPNDRLMATEFGRRVDVRLTERFGHLRRGDGWGDMAGEAGASQATEETANWNRLAAKAAGIRIRPQRIGANVIQPRLEAVRAPLEFVQGGRPGLLIHPRCKYLIRGFEARYVWKDEVDANGDKRKVPDKSLTEANVMDALQYLLLSKHKANGLSPISFPHGDMGHNGGPPMHGRPMQDPGGLSTGYDVLNPYGA